MADGVFPAQHRYLLQRHGCTRLDAASVSMPKGQSWDFRRERATAAGIVVSLWVALVLLYDLALLGLVVADQGQALSGDIFRVLLLANPTDAYRLFNLLGFEQVSLLSGMAGLADEAAISPAAPLAALVAWTLLPLIVAVRIVQRREL